MRLVLSLLAAALLATTPAAATELPLTLDTPTGRLHGTLTLPPAAAQPGAPRPPVVLLIAGSGPTDRDGNTPLAGGRNDSLRLLAAGLRDAGLASLRYDKRGVAASQAAARAEADLRFDHLVDDAAAWVALLAQDARFAGVAVLGHSEGALIGLRAAQRSPARAVVSLAGPAERAPALLRRQLLGRLPLDLAVRSEEILRALEAGRTVEEVPAALAALYRPSVQPYLISWFRLSPTEEIARLRLPCLIVQGGTDLQVAPKDAEALHAANPACALRQLPGMNHVLKTVPADPARQMASYGDPSLPLDAGLVPALAAFLKALAAPPEAAGR